jgi:hypothetical protein
MNAFVVSAAVGVLAPILIDVIKDAIKPEGVLSARDELIQIGNELVEKTEWELDDKLYDVVVERAFSLDNISEKGRKILLLGRKYVAHSKTKYDDYLIPVFDKAIEVLLSFDEADEDEPEAPEAEKEG